MIYVVAIPSIPTTDPSGIAATAMTESVGNGGVIKNDAYVAQTVRTSAILLIEIITFLRLVKSIPAFVKSA